MDYSISNNCFFEEEFFDEPDFEVNCFGGSYIAHMLKVKEEVLINIAKAKKMEIRHWLNLPFFDANQIKVFANTLGKPTPKFLL
tara:strand:+ start:323 stop:574 length:252 start_codon:yes stop_codon:yes gene_type:complete